MTKLNAFYITWSPRLLSILRIITAFVFMVHGSQKLFGMPVAPNAPLELLSLLGLAAVLEFFGGLLLLIGLFTRPVAFILSGQMAVAYFMVFASKGFWPLVNKGELAVVYCFLFLYISATGGGPWSIDHLFCTDKP